jgi:hypothetical protein
VQSELPELVVRQGQLRLERLRLAKESYPVGLMMRRAIR